MDVKALGDWLAANSLSLILTVAALLVGVFLLRRLAARWAGIEENLAANWRLGLLGATGVVLSLASGWTTWDGMRHFTNEPVLSAMITFGIQGVMLIAAWLIGETFAVGMSEAAGAKGAGRGNATAFLRAAVGGALGLATFLTLVLLGLHTVGLIDVRMPQFFSFDWGRAGDRYLLIAAAVLSALLLFFSGTGLARPYVQGARIIIRNAVLWVMFLACMATSVFFSFDSLFSVIFTHEERARAAGLRAQNQVAGLMASLGQTLAARHEKEAEAYFGSSGWRAYERELDRAAEAVRQSEEAIARYARDQAETRIRSVRELQERIATAQTGLGGLETRKTILVGEVTRLKSERPALAAEFGERKADLDARTREAEAKRIEALAEDKGVEGSGKEGKGPVWRQRMAELAKLQAARQVSEERFKEAKKRLDTLDARLAQGERELAALDGELAKLKGDAATASERIKLLEGTAGADAGREGNPAGLALAFDKARTGFRQNPSAANLAAVHRACLEIVDALSRSEVSRAKAQGIACDPKTAIEAGTALFALNAGRENFATNCTGGDKLARLNSADELFGFARQCLTGAGLPSKDTDALRARLNNMELNRDDKAHRFVVTWNAFEDGNRLAYLALAIAIAVDGLIFLSGLFGANAARSPLSDVPQDRARSAQRLEAVINSALGARRYETASLVLSTLRPAANSGGFSALSVLEGLDRGEADRVRRVLTAGAAIGAVEPAGTTPESYRVRGELREYLALIHDRHLRADPSHARRDQLEYIIRAALQPCPKEHAAFVASVFEPIKATQGFTSTVLLRDIPGVQDNRLVRRVMNAGATLDAVRPDSQDADRYYITPDLYRVLLEIAAHDPPSPYAATERTPLQLGPRGGTPPPAEGGDITPRPDAITDQRPFAPALPKGKGLEATVKDGIQGFLGRIMRSRPAPESHQGEASDRASGPADEEGGPAPENGSQEPAAGAPSGVTRGFAQKLALSTDHLTALLDPRHLEAVPGIERHLAAIARHDVRFRNRLDALRESQRQAIARAVDSLGKEGWGGVTVDGVAAHLRRILPLILLTEHGAYARMLDTLLLEAGDNAPEDFSPGRLREWIRIVRDHAEELAALSRKEPGHWNAVQDSLARLAARLDSFSKAEKTGSMG